MRTLIVLLGVLIGAPVAESQTAVSGDLLAHIDSLITAIPSGTGTDQYQVPPPAARSTWGTIITRVLAGEPAAADSLAATIGYQLLAFENTASPSTGLHYILEKTRGSSNHWGFYLINPSPLRPDLMIMCPHPLYDRNTALQGGRVYAEAGPRAFGVSGAHRCNSTLFSPCSGTTTACGGSSESYRLSDQAHTVDGVFQATTAALLAFNDSTIQVQLHGFSKTSTDPDIIMSNGTSKTPPAGQDYLLALRDALTVVDPTLTFKVGHLDTDWTRLLGTTNVQGRLINGSPSPCSVSASAATGRFLHLEQKYSGLRDSETGWQKMATAVTMAFPATATAIRNTSGLAPSAFLVHQNYPNPFNPTTTIVVELPEARHMTVTILDLLGREVAVLLAEPRPAGATRLRWDAGAQPSGPYFCVVNAGAWRDVVRLMLVK